MAGNWIQLANGNGYDFDEAEIFGRFTMETDLAQPLAGANRYVRHTSVPWPVALHSVIVAQVIEAMTGNADAAAAGLLHDAHEAIIGDIPTPVAWVIGYDRVVKLKAEVQAAIHRELDIPARLMPDGPYKPLIDHADQAALHVERQLLLAPEPREWNVPYPPHPWLLETHDRVHAAQLDAAWREDCARRMFCQEYHRLVTPLIGGK